MPYDRPLESPQQHRLRRLAEDLKFEAWNSKDPTDEELQALRKKREEEKEAFNRQTDEAERTAIQARLDKEGGIWLHSLCDGDRKLDAELKMGKFNKAVWLLARDEQQRYRKTFIPTGKHSRIQRELGLHEERILYPARVARVNGHLTIVKDVE